MKEEMNIKRGGGRIRGKISSYKHVLSKRGDKTFKSDIRRKHVNSIRALYARTSIR